MSNLPKYTEKKKKGNVGESLVRYILSNFCLVHQIDGSYDVGNDMICELIKDEYPTNLLFYVQVKHTERKPNPRKETLEYWKGSPIPVYLFWVEDKKSSQVFNKLLSNNINIDFNTKFKKIKYKRYTPVLHKDKYKNEKFKIFSKQLFLRDLIVDYARCQYIKGFTPIIKPRDFLTFDEKINIGFPQYLVLIKKVIPEYEKDILKKSWATIFAIAVLLYNRGDRNNLEKAHRAIILAKELFEENREKNQNGDFRSNFVEFFKIFEEYEMKISASLNDN